MSYLLEINKMKLDKKEVSANDLLLTLNSKLDIRDAIIVNNYKSWTTKF